MFVYIAGQTVKFTELKQNLKNVTFSSLTDKGLTLKSIISAQEVFFIRVLDDLWDSSKFGRAHRTAGQGKPHSRPRHTAQPVKAHRTAGQK